MLVGARRCHRPAAIVAQHCTTVAASVEASVETVGCTNARCSVHGRILWQSPIVALREIDSAGALANREACV